MGQIGRLIGVGIGKEVTRGTPVAPAYFLPLTDFDYDDKVELAVKEGRKSVIELSHGGDVVKEWGEGTMGGDIKTESFGLILLASFGAVSTAANADLSGNVYDHTFSIDNATNPNNHQSLTLSLEDAEAGDKEYSSVIVTSLEITAEEGAYVKFSAGLMGNSEAAGTETSSYATEYSFRPQDLAFKYATTSAGLSGASATGIKSLTLSVEKNAEANYNLGSKAPSEFFNKQLTGTLDIELIHVDDTLRDLWKAGTTHAFEIDIVNTDVVIGTAANPELLITCYQGQITEWTRNQGNDDIVTETLSIRLDYSDSDSKSVGAVLTNLVTSY